jgi:hypothetical protein
MEPTVYTIIGVIIGALVEFLAIIAGMYWMRERRGTVAKVTAVKTTTAREFTAVQQTEPVKEPTVSPFYQGVIARNTASEPKKMEVVHPRIGVPVAEPVATDKSLPSAQFNQHFWYFVQGHEKPFPTLKEALSLFPVEYAKYGKDRRPTWDEIPKDIQGLMRREAVVRTGKGK